jgi:hypothetical protein
VTSFPSVLQLLPECFRTPRHKLHTLAKQGILFEPLIFGKSTQMGTGGTPPIRQ